ncbi:hypothetical protein P3X46_031073 [Hevea brasiliensis]|uniref:Uncharacterized protein n=1 Tax=Hevea brasiliensis TaxID=3981 RepID=A0ABQ9KJ55_HEVBR|nr:hypothetical protein P3X46_031073 [Hevea brasiliensis]
MPGPYMANPNDWWHRNPSFDYREGFGLPVYDHNNTNGNIGEVDGRYKRPRRILKLIRDHGGALSGDLTNVRYSLDFNASYGRIVDMNNHFEYSRNWEPGGGVGHNRLQNDGSNMFCPFRPNAGKQQARGSLSLPYQVPEVRNEPYGDLNLPQNQFNDSMSAEGSQYSHMRNWQDNRPSQSYGMPNYLRPDYQFPGHVVSTMNEPGGYLPCPENRAIGGQPLPPPPPRPASPPTPVPIEFKGYTSPLKTSLFPVPISSSATNSVLQNKPLSHVSIAFSSEQLQTSSLSKQLSPDKQTISQLFKHGKSYLAKMMRELEVANGGNAPWIHSMDDYFMTEVEKVEDSNASKSSSLGRNKTTTVKKVMEYFYEPEMEEGSGYEVYISEATYKDPVWEEAPALYLQLYIKSLFHRDDLKESGIQEVDMDTEDGSFDYIPPGLLDRKTEKTVPVPLEADAPQVPPEDGKRWDVEEEHPTQGVKALSKSKWSDDLDENDTEGCEGIKGNLNVLTWLIQAYGKQGKSVHWSDQVGNNGFSIGAAKKAIMRSLVIGPGAGYNLYFPRRLRAEHESFKAVFDKRRQRIGGLDLEE